MSEFRHGFAVVVGVGADLPVTIEDAKAISDMLCDPERCAYPTSQVQLLVEEKARREGILNALDKIKEQTKADADAMAIVYFSGHGVESPDYFFLPYGYNTENLMDTGISGADFTSKLQAIQAKKLLVLLDCCHAGGLAAPKDQYLAKAPLPPSAITNLGQSSGRVIIASSRKDEVSWTGHPFSVFTGALLEAYAGYGSFEEDGYARVLDVAMYVGRMVPDRTADKQHPIVKVANLQDNFSVAYYAAGSKQPKKLTWSAVASVPSRSGEQDTTQIASWQRMLVNYRENLLLIEERMSEYVVFTEIPLQLIKQKGQTGSRIADLERKLGIRA